MESSVRIFGSSEVCCWKRIEPPPAGLLANSSVLAWLNNFIRCDFKVKTIEKHGWPLDYLMIEQKGGSLR
jgi:hypothetical protein